jgi:hypothetical protein
MLFFQPYIGTVHTLMRADVATPEHLNISFPRSIFYRYCTENRMLNTYCTRIRERANDLFVIDGKFIYCAVFKEAIPYNLNTVERYIVAVFVADMHVRRRFTTDFRVLRFSSFTWYSYCVRVSFSIHSLRQSVSLY